MNISASSNYGNEINQTRMQQMRQAMFSKLDEDGDGTISSSELSSATKSSSSSSGQSLSASKILSALDADQDGSISSSEFSTGMDSFDSAMQALAQSSGAKGMRPPPPPPDGASAEDMFSKMDSDGDGSVSKSEFEAASPDGNTSRADKIFSTIDTDQDGTISASENEAAMAKFASEQNSQLKNSSTSESSTSLEAGKSMFLQKLLDNFMTMAQSDFSTTSTSTKSVSAYA